MSIRHMETKINAINERQYISHPILRNITGKITIQTMIFRNTTLICANTINDSRKSNFQFKKTPTP